MEELSDMPVKKSGSGKQIVQTVVYVLKLIFLMWVSKKERHGARHL